VSELSDYINGILKKEGVCEIPMKFFIKEWFKGRPISDKDFVKKLFDFEKKHKLDHVMVLNSVNKQVISVRFWRIKEIKQIAENTNNDVGPGQEEAKTTTSGV